MATSRKLLLVFGLALGALAALVFTLAFVAILWNDPVFSTPPDVSPEALAASGIDLSQPYASAPRRFRARDGVALVAQTLPALSAESRTTVLLVHGLLGSSFTLNRASGLLREAAGADLVTIDLRGHGASGGHPGDVDYIGQYEDDLADVVRVLRAEHPGGRIVLAGHSMGGGIALRYAERERGEPVDAFLLLAPYLGWESPSTRKTATPEAEAAGARFMRVHIARILGLEVLNSVGITAFNGLRTVLFNLPEEMPLRSYSYRAMENAAPTDYRRALRSVRAPVLVLAGDRDEAFDARGYAPALTGYDRVRFVLIPEATHEGLLRDSRTMDAVREWLGANMGDCAKSATSPAS